jgi:CBS domain containing-hemolysin-like protein
MMASLLLLAMGLLGSAICAGSETGYYALNPLKLRVAAVSSRLAALLMRITRPPHAFLTMLLVGNNVANYLTVSAGVAFLALVSVPQPELVATIALTPVTFVLGEVGPKQFVLHNPLGIMLRVTPLLAILRVIFAPLTFLIGALGRLLAREDADAVAGRRHLAALLLEGTRAGHNEAPVLQAALRALESEGKGLSPWLRTDLPVLYAGIPLPDARVALARTSDTLALLERRGKLPGLLLGSRLVHGASSTPVEPLAVDLPLLAPDLDLSDALAQLRAKGISFALVGTERAWDGVLDLEHALSLLLRPEIRSSHA